MVSRADATEELFDVSEFCTSCDSGISIIISGRGDPRWTLEEWERLSRESTSENSEVLCTNRDKRIRNGQICCAYHHQGCPPYQLRCSMPLEAEWAEVFDEVQNTPELSDDSCTIHSNWKQGEPERLIARMYANPRHCLVFCGSSDRVCFKRPRGNAYVCKSHFWGCPCHRYTLQHHK